MVFLTRSNSILSKKGFLHQYKEDIKENLSGFSCFKIEIGLKNAKKIFLLLPDLVLN